MIIKSGNVASSQAPALFIPTRFAFFQFLYFAHHVLDQFHCFDQGRFRCDGFPEHAGAFQILKGGAQCREFFPHHFSSMQPLMRSRPNLSSNGPAFDHPQHSLQRSRHGLAPHGGAITQEVEGLR